MTFKRRFRLFLHQWHRRLGLTAAFFVVVLSLSGLLLNHSAGLKLGHLYPQSSIWLWPYSSVQSTQDTVGFNLPHGWVYESSSESSEAVWINEQRIPECSPPLSSVAYDNRESWLLCGHSILILSMEPSPDSRHEAARVQIAEVIERSLLPYEINALGFTKHGVAIQVRPLQGTALSEKSETWKQFDLALMDATEALNSEDVCTIPLQALPSSLNRNHHITWERVLLDLHSGRWFGTYGVWIMDIAAIILLLLAGSGIWMWSSRKRRH